jgi:hypothetical protein
MLYNLKQAQGFLGCAGYHCMFCKNFSTIANPITHLTKKDELFVWGLVSRLSTHYLCKSSKRLDGGLELEVIEE